MDKLIVPIILLLVLIGAFFFLSMPSTVVGPVKKTVEKPLSENVSMVIPKADAAVEKGAFQEALLFRELERFSAGLLASVFFTTR